MAKETSAHLSFEEILRDKIAASEASEETQTSSEKTSTDSVNFHFFDDFSSRIIAEKSFFRGKIGSHYPQKASRSSPKIVKLKPLEPIVHVTLLSPAAQIALSRLGLNGRVDIRFSEVKQAYRRLARTTHPDLQKKSSSHDFIALKEASDLVLSEIRNLTTAPATAA